MANKLASARYGISELYGKLYKLLDRAGRMELVDQKDVGCRFRADMPGLAPKKGTKCTKKGGVCSLRSFTPGSDGGIDFGPITATCPSRFLEGGIVFKNIARVILDTEEALIVKEIPFLIRPQESGGANQVETAVPPGSDNEDVGRIDMVMVHPATDKLLWCAVEIQAVYFSGDEMKKDFDAIRSHIGDNVPMPGGSRRPDFRSCGPKRLMPQLQIKVPTLRRWGRKMAVVVDRPFFDSLGPMDLPFISVIRILCGLSLDLMKTLKVGWPGWWSMTSAIQRWSVLLKDSLRGCPLHLMILRRKYGAS